MHPTKTKIVYCKGSNRKGNYPNVSFDFLGYCFRPRRAENARTKQVFCNFLPAISQSALESMRATVRDLDIRRRTHVSMDDIAQQLNPLLRGWIEYTMEALGIGTFPAICQSGAAGLGYAEVQELEGSQD